MTKLPDKMKREVEEYLITKMSFARGALSTAEHAEGLFAAVASGMEEADNSVELSRYRNALQYVVESAKRTEHKPSLSRIAQVCEMTLNGGDMMDVLRENQPAAQPPSVAPAQGTDGIGADEWHAQRASYENRIQLLLQEIASLKSAPSLPADEGTRHITVDDRVLDDVVNLPLAATPKDGGLEERVKLAEAEITEAIVSHAAIGARPSPGSIRAIILSHLTATPACVPASQCGWADNLTADISRVIWGLGVRGDEYLGAIKAVRELIVSVPAGDGRDKERLDWLDEPSSVEDTAHRLGLVTNQLWQQARNLRAAIDAAQSSTQQGGTSK